MYLNIREMSVKANQVGDTSIDLVINCMLYDDMWSWLHMCRIHIYLDDNEMMCTI